ncbi:MAG: beta-aspartyl-peptidase [Campylobacteraceae bacterium]|nr:beta-aspartyl-peptidase [Campylobacteraceae bacterium]
MLLIKNAQVYSPKFLGKKDILVEGEKISLIDDSINLNVPNLHVIDATGCVLTPGFIDKHVHITGGGGEGGFSSRAPEIGLSKLIEGGITTVVGLLGTDGTTRCVENLVAKAYALREEGVSCYAHTGAYELPVPTLTGSIQKDIVFIDPIIGIKLAISDHRASSVTRDELARVAGLGRVSGMIGKKSGHVTLHVGDGKKGLGLIYDVLNEYDTPITLFQPTHVNRNPKLFEEGKQFLRDGGYVDLTCYSPSRFTPVKAYKELKSEDIPLDKLTFSSDGYGSFSNYDKDGNLLNMGVATVKALYYEFLEFMKAGYKIEEVLPFITSNVAKSIGLGKIKGQILPNYDADILILDKDFDIKFVIAKGKVLKDDKGYIKQGNYEQI